MIHNLLTNDDLCRMQVGTTTVESNPNAIYLESRFGMTILTFKFK